MITQSFVFLDGVSQKTEQNLWDQGIFGWNELIQSDELHGISKKRKFFYENELKKAKEALHSYNSSYFMGKLPQSEMWRLYEHFKDEAVFLDIETTGMARYDDITVIGLFDGLNTKTMIKNINMDISALKRELENYKLIVTFNGASFDLPFLRKRYPELLPEIPHFDLKVACGRIGLSGGLKKIEKILGINRSQIVGDMTGGDAVTLWRMYKASGDEYYLNLLVEYNEEDCVNLKRIADHSVNELKRRCLNGAAGQ